MEGNRVHFVAAAGKTNDVSVRLDRGAYLVTEPAGVAAGPGCTVVSSTQARCSTTGGTSVILELGDGDDRGTANVAVAIFGGDGGDTITGSSFGDNIQGGVGNNTLNAGDGNDFLTAGSGTDVLDGGPGLDYLFESSTSADVVDVDTLRGGPGVDTVSYQADTGAHTTSLDGVANDGKPTERDNVAADVEGVFGSLGNDTVSGDADANTVLGGDGNDVIVGNDGDDDLQGGFGVDTLSGGNGTDRCVGVATPVTSPSSARRSGGIPLDQARHRPGG